ncbi:hypothetical protein [Haloarcula sp. CGMCC 1.2071]|uniref:hypothetical protein n=1 Tax=Haloarcula sp. CGMCC 1.2071 TaxID=3111454 RepID=UPI00300EE183
MSEYTGDVTLNGGIETPVRMSGLEDMYVQPDSIDGDLDLRNVEYVFTGVPITPAADVADPVTDITGTLEDGYTEPDGVHGDLAVGTAEDVFIAHGAVDGALSARGPEQVFDAGTSNAPSRDPATYDVTVSGWQQQREVTDPNTGVVLSGCQSTVNVTGATGSVSCYLIGTNNELIVRGDASVEVHIVGRDNRVDLGPYIDVDTAVETGFDNTIDVQPFPADDLIETTEDEAYSAVTFGRAKVTYQSVAEDEDWCRGCGEAADAIIERQQKEAFFILGMPIITYEEGGGSYECEHCAHSAPDTSLTPEERREIF